MNAYIDMDAFIAQLRARRGSTGLQKLAKELGGVSASTLSRIENGKKVPDMVIYLRLCEWMGVQPDTFFRTPNSSPKPPVDTPQIIEAHLRADKKLDEQTALAIAHLVRTAYELNSRSEPSRE